MLDRRLADRAYVAGDYSIADMTCYPWIVPHERQQQRLEDFLNLKRWFEAIRARAAVARDYEKGRAVSERANAISDHSGIDSERNCQVTFTIAVRLEHAWPPLRERQSVQELFLRADITMRPPGLGGDAPIPADREGGADDSEAAVQEWAVASRATANYNGMNYSYQGPSP